MKFLRLLPLSALLLCACEKPEAKVNATDAPAEPQVSAAELAELAAKEAKIEELEREIESSAQIIDDLEAAVHMERTKLEDDPDYDQSFLNEILADQDREREEIKKAKEELKGLK